MAKMLTKAAGRRNCRCCWNMHSNTTEARRAQRTREKVAWRKEI